MARSIETRISRLEAAAPTTTAAEELLENRLTVLRVARCLPDCAYDALSREIAELERALKPYQKPVVESSDAAELVARIDEMFSAAMRREEKRQAGLRAYRAPEARVAEEVPAMPWGAGDPEIDERVPYTVKAAARRQGQKPWWC